MKSITGKFPKTTGQIGEQTALSPSPSGSIIRKMQDVPSTAARGIIRKFPRIPASEQIIKNMNSCTGSRFRISPDGIGASRVRFLQNDSMLTGAAQNRATNEQARVKSALFDCMTQSGFGAQEKALKELAGFIKGRAKASPCLGEYDFGAKQNNYLDGAVPPGFGRISSHALYIKGPGIDLTMHIAFGTPPRYIFCIPGKEDAPMLTGDATNFLCGIIETIKAARV